MKALLALFVLAGVALFSRAITEEQLEELKHFSMECMQTSGVTHDALAKAETGEFASDPQLANYFFCMFKKPGFMNEAGEFVIDNIKDDMTRRFGEEFANKVIQDCIEFDGPMTEKAAHFAKCIFERRPPDLM